ncbi:MAG: type II toxin-antitoxin system RelE/ParE family toxin [Burkholderiales bacterium]|jgi:putative addiction module killer protein|nr:type II toxin-antitoxin system RelE/ParE family toxin [Burkholderiales bacterium]
MKYELDRTEDFAKWVAGLSKSDRNRLASRLARVENGNFGDHKQLADILFELRCFFDGGLRVYFTIRKNTIVLLLAGGDKDTQRRDVARARALLNELED